MQSQLEKASRGGQVVKWQERWESHSSCDKRWRGALIVIREALSDMKVKDQSRADGPVRKKTGCCPVGLRKSEH